MLYLSTRDPADSFTAHRVLNNSFAADGGMFVPMQMPRFDERQLLQMKQMSFSEVVATVLNLFFDTKISGWDIEFQIGRSPYKLAEISHRLIIAQLWHNHGSNYSYFERAVYEKLGGKSSSGAHLPQWPQIAIRIAVLFGIYSKLQGIQCIDVAVPAGDFDITMAVWYAAEMGLPVEMIICGCDESSGVWDLICRGEIMPVSAPRGVERLIYDAFGREETKRYLDVYRSKRVYKTSPEQQDKLAQRIYACVASEKRVVAIAKSFAKGFPLDPSAVIAYCALQDYRAGAGESKPTLIMADVDLRQ